MGELAVHCKHNSEVLPERRLPQCCPAAGDHTQQATPCCFQIVETIPWQGALNEIVQTLCALSRFESA